MKKIEYQMRKLPLRILEIMNTFLQCITVPCSCQQYTCIFRHLLIYELVYNIPSFKTTLLQGTLTSILHRMGVMLMDKKQFYCNTEKNQADYETDLAFLFILYYVFKYTSRACFN